MECDANFLQVSMAPVLIQSLGDMVDVHFTIGRQYNFCCLNLQCGWFVGIAPYHGYLLVAEGWNKKLLGTAVSQTTPRL
jgi:hypothetical protein